MSSASAERLPRVTGLALLSATIIIAHQVAGKATRDALFLSHFDVTSLPRMVIAAGILSILGVLTMSRLLTRHGPAHLVPTLFGVSAVLFVAEWYLLQIYPDAASIAVYIHMAFFSGVLISGFWSVVNERFDPHLAKRVIARVAAAATLGGVLGGVVADRVANLARLDTMLLVLAGAHLLCIVTVWGVGRGTINHPSHERENPRSGLKILWHTPYLRNMALLMALSAAVAALLDYTLKAQAAARYTSGEELVTFFATFYSLVGVVTFGVQTFLGRPFLKHRGLGQTLGLMPLSVLLGGFIVTSLTNLWTTVVLRGGQAILANSFYRSGFEILYTPVPPDKKRPTKTIIDVASDRLGDIAGGGLILLLLALVPELPNSLIIAFAMLAATLSLWVVRRLSHGYVEQLAENLRNGSLQLPDTQDLDATTRGALDGSGAVTRQQDLLQRLRQQQADARPAADRPPASTHPPLEDPCLSAIAILRGGATGEIRHLLHDQPLSRELVAHALPLLEHPELHADADAALKRISPRITGQLVDALLDQELPVTRRKRLPRILASGASYRSADGLLLGLDSEAFEIRYLCGLALDQLRLQHPDLRISRRRLLGAAGRELSIATPVWDARRLGTDQDAPVPGDSRGWSTQRANRSLEHVFTLLGLGYDREVMRMSRNALLSGDPNLQGTAMEYLDNALPEDLRQALWQHLGRPQGSNRSERSRKEILTDLLESARALVTPNTGGRTFPSHQSGGYLVIELQGDLDMQTSATARAQILAQLERGQDLLVDLEQVPYMDSSGIAVLVEALQLARARQARFGLTRLGEGPMQVLRLARLDQVFPILDPDSPD